jgi:beta-galactosidase
LTKNTFGKGTAWYYGAAFNEFIAGEIIEMLGLKSLTDAICEVPLHVETVVRHSRDARLIFLLNYSAQPQEIHFKQEVLEILHGNTLLGSVEMEAYGVMIVRPSV